MLAAGRDVTVDDLNLRARYVREWYAFAVQHDAMFTIKDFTTVPLETCLYRAQHRAILGGRLVPDEVIRDLWQRFISTHGWTVPDLDAPAPRGPLTAPYDPASGEGRPQAWIVDMDGTLALMQTGERARGPFDWPRVGEDDPHTAVLALTAALTAADQQLIVMSGRSAVCRDQTIAWLQRYQVRFAELLMRPAGDHRQDAIVKAELFDAHVRGRYDVQGVIDDRDQVVALWRSMGLTCLQANYGDF